MFMYRDYHSHYFFFLFFIFFFYLQASAIAALRLADNCAFASMAKCCRNGLCYFVAMNCSDVRALNYFDVRSLFEAAGFVAVALRRDINSGFQHFGFDFHFLSMAERLAGWAKQFCFALALGFARAHWPFDFRLAAAPASVRRSSAKGSYAAYFH